ncbi:MAG: hypothetical protein ACLQVI_39140 [Polyangiaceae bacterium]
MVPVRRFGLAALLILATGVALAACSKPQLGGKCVAGQGACVDAKNGLYCGSDMTYKAMTCNGDHGCAAQGSKIECDNDIAAAGDGCDTPNDGACTADHKSLLQCKNEKFVLIDTCKGPGACKIAGDVLNCDNDIADVGDICSNDKNFACTTDKGMALQCSGGKYAPAQSCRGQKACTIVHPKPKVTDIDCDYTVANENDPCVVPGNDSCSLDKTKMFTCKGGKYTDATPCPGPNGCTIKVTQKSAKGLCDGAGGTNPPDPNTPPKKHHHGH